MKLVYAYLLLVNAAGLLIMRYDKQQSRKNRWRIREATLMWFAAVGGSIGIYAGMQLFHHKTLHPKFSIGVPIILVLQVLLLVFLIIHKTSG